MTGSAVEIRKVYKRFGDQVVVDGLSLSVPRGSVYGLLGPNGAGKTTTLRMLLNIIAPDEGSIEILGSPPAAAGLTDLIGYLPEERGLYRRMQVRRLLRFLAALKGVPARVADIRITDWLTRLDLRTDTVDWGLAKVDELSRGMQQKVQFIATLLHEPEIIILDEPFSGLDPMNAQALKDTVIDLKRRGKTIIFSTHLMDNAERMCDFVCILAGGRKVLDGAIAEVKAESGGQRVALALDTEESNGAMSLLRDSALVRQLDDSNRYFEIELAGGVQPQELLRRLVTAGLAIRRFELIQPSLHQIFLQKVNADRVEPGMSGHG